MEKTELSRGFSDDFPGGLRSTEKSQHGPEQDAVPLCATICVAAFALAKSGILKGRKATTYHLKGGYKQKELEQFGVDVVNEPVVKDGNLITSYCPQTAPFVAFALLEMLTSAEKMNLVMGAMGY